MALLVAYPICRAFNAALCDMYRVLSLRKKTFVVYTSHEPIDNHEIEDFFAYDYERGNTFVNVASGYILGQFKLLKELNRHKSKARYAVFFIGHPPIITLLLSKIWGLKTIWILPSHIEMFSGRWYSSLLSMAAQICYRATKVIVVYSENIIDEWGLDEYRDKIVIANQHLIDPSQFCITTPLNQRKLTIGYVGRLCEEKGILQFLQAIPLILDQNKNIQILIGGDGGRREEVERFISRLANKERVEIRGWIPYDDLPQTMNELSLLVVPSYTEGLPNTVLEAAACGTPILSTPVGTIPNIITDGETGFIMPNNSPEEIAKNVFRALEHPRLDSITDNARDMILALFTLENKEKMWDAVWSKADDRDSSD